MVENRNRVVSLLRFLLYELWKLEMYLLLIMCVGRKEIIVNYKDFLFYFLRISSKINAIVLLESI